MMSKFLAISTSLIIGAFAAEGIHLVNCSGSLTQSMVVVGAFYVL